MGVGSMATITAKDRHGKRLKLDWEWTQDRNPRFEVFAPDGFLFNGDVSSFVCLDRSDALDRISQSELEEEAS
jgi:hypothetical protein